MNLLAFDTSCDACSAAVWRDGTVVAHEAAAMVRGQSEDLVPMIARVMDQAGESFVTLKAVAVTVGPGAFTGLRIGLATARAIALAADRPVIGISTFEVLAAAAAAEADLGPSPIIVAIDTKRGDLYIQHFKTNADATSETGARLRAASPAAVMSPADAASQLPAGRLLLAGDGALQLLAAMGAASARATVARAKLPDAGHLASLAAAKLAAGLPSESLRPFYLRPPAARLPQPAIVGALP